MEWITIAAIIIGPIAAVQIQKWIEQATEEKREKRFIFKTLMRTRGNPTSRDHVNALNMIQFTFSQKNEEDSAVLRKWEIYLNHLNTPYPINESEAKQLDWTNKQKQCLTDLLMALAKAFGYQIDEEHINRVYAPMALATEAAEIVAIRHHVLQLLQGKEKLNTNATLFPGNLTLAQQFNELLFKVLKGESALKIHNANEKETPTPKLTAICSSDIDGCTVTNHLSTGFNQAFRVAVNSNCFDPVKNCQGQLRSIKGSSVGWSGDTAILTFAPAENDDSTSRTIRHNETVYLDILFLEYDKDWRFIKSYPGTKDRQWRFKPAWEEIFAEHGEYILAFKIVSDSPTIDANLRFVWTGSRHTSKMELIPPPISPG